MSGFCTSAARLGAPDAGLLSYGEMVDQGRYVNEATSQLPIIGDGDTGYGTPPTAALPALCLGERWLFSIFGVTGTATLLM